MCIEMRRLFCSDSRVTPGRQLRREGPWGAAQLSAQEARGPERTAREKKYDREKKFSHDRKTVEILKKTEESLKMENKKTVK